jgi:hypothetical protein
MNPEDPSQNQSTEPALNPDGTSVTPPPSLPMGNAETAPEGTPSYAKPAEDSRTTEVNDKIVSRDSEPAPSVSKEPAPINPSGENIVAKKGRPHVWLWAVIALLVLAILGVSAWLGFGMLTKNSKTGSSNKPAEAANANPAFDFHPSFGYSVGNDDNGKPVKRTNITLWAKNDTVDTYGLIGFTATLVDANGTEYKDRPFLIYNQPWRPGEYGTGEILFPFDAPPTETTPKIVAVKDIKLNDAKTPIKEAIQYAKEHAGATFDKQNIAVETPKTGSYTITSSLNRQGSATVKNNTNKKINGIVVDIYYLEGDKIVGRGSQYPDSAQISIDLRPGESKTVPLFITAPLSIGSGSSYAFKFSNYFMTYRYSSSD